MSSGVSGSLEMLFSKMENFITTKTVVGDAIMVGDVVILPLIDVVFGVGAGGAGGTSETNKEESGNGGGLGAKLTPSAVIVVVGGNVQLINLKNQDGISKLIDMAPGIISKLNLGSLFNKDKDKDKDKDKETEKTKDIKITETHFVEDGEDVIVKSETVAKEINE